MVHLGAVVMDEGRDAQANAGQTEYGGRGGDGGRGGSGGRGTVVLQDKLKSEFLLIKQKF